jgi:flavin reductase (DIM6/NTAB) family NADH-FMN oxidoreductase RutF
MTVEYGVFGGFRQPIPLESTQTFRFYMLSENVLPTEARRAAGTATRQATAISPMTRAKAKSPNFDPTEFRAALGQFATGVTVITTRTDSGQLIGITASSFNSVSLNPPLVLWSLATKSASMPVFRANSHYVVNVLAASQLDLCRRFATLKGDRFAGVSHAAGDTGMPVLDGAIAWFECHNRSRYDEGDHVIFVGEVERCGVRAPTDEATPLVFHAGDFHTLGPIGS